MDENIVYNLNGVNLDRNTNVDIHQLYEDYSINFSDEDEQLANEMNNLYNCNVGELKKIIEYYNVHDENLKISPFNSIKIKYIGLGIGEKLNEELVIGDVIKKTNRKKILQAEEVYIPWPILLSYLDELKDYIVKKDDSKVMQLIEKILSR